MTYPLTQKCSENTYTGLVTPLPGCPDIAVSHRVFRSEGEGGEGKKAATKRLQQLKKAGFSAVLCTVDSSNVKQIKILHSTGWIFCKRIYNKRTKHNIDIFTKAL